MKFQWVLCLIATFYGLSSNATVRLTDGLLDQDRAFSLGLPAVPATHQTLYFAPEETYRFCHHANLAVFQDNLYAMWTNGILNENETGQRVLWSMSGDGINWKDWSVLVEDPDGIPGPFFAVATGFLPRENSLVAYFASIRDPEPIHRESAIYTMFSSDGKIFNPPEKLIDGYGIEAPRALPSGRILMSGQRYPVPHGLSQPPPRALYSDNPDGLHDWIDVMIPAFPDFESRFPEGSWFVRRDGSIVMLFRAHKSIPWVYASESRDSGETWIPPVATNIPSAWARMATGRFPDGRIFCVWNPSQKFGRNPLVIALSEDGYVFDRAYVLRGEATAQNFKGKRKSDGWQYPSAVVWKDTLWVAYSQNKENIIISRINLHDFR